MIMVVDLEVECDYGFRFVLNVMVVNLEVECDCGLGFES